MNKCMTQDMVLSAIPDEVRREMRYQLCQAQVQQKQVVHLFLEGQMGWHDGILVLPVPEISHPN